MKVTTTMADPNIGRSLMNRYKLQELVGTGAMGRVYLAQDLLLGGVPVAVKFLSLSIQNPKMRMQERFETEAKTCALLGQKSIHIVRVMDYGVDDKKTPFYVMEYLEGASLSHVIRTQTPSLTRFLSLARQICLGLQCAHDGIPIDGKICPIIHRDIKPSNMLVIQDPSLGELAKVLDFGIAKLVQSDSEQTKYYLGTLAYSSPEQMEGKELDNRSDIYSLGVMMFEMLTGKMPFLPETHSFGAWYKVHHYQQPRSFAEVAPQLQLPKELEELVNRCLAKSPRDRPQNIGQIVQLLSQMEQKYSSSNNPSSNSNNSYSSSNPSNNPAPSRNLVKIEPEKPKIPTPVAEKSQDIQQHDTQNTYATSISSYPELNPQISWPKTKPIADIVFPQLVKDNEELIPTLWVMLPKQEIQKRLVCARYNQFLFITNPHPMMLWITVIYNRLDGAKWLPYYLDLKSNFGQQVTTVLGEVSQYKLLFFAREEPHHCNHILVSSIAAAQSQRLKKWVQMSSTMVSTANSQMSKSLLKREYEKIKPEILVRLEAINTDSPVDLSSNS
jgi:serine/threonine-protein kinase